MALSVSNCSKNSLHRGPLLLLLLALPVGARALLRLLPSCGGAAALGPRRRVLLRVEGARGGVASSSSELLGLLMAVALCRKYVLSIGDWKR